MDENKNKGSRFDISFFLRDLKKASTTNSTAVRTFVIILATTISSVVFISIYFIPLSESSRLIGPTAVLVIITLMTVGILFFKYLSNDISSYGINTNSISIEKVIDRLERDFHEFRSDLDYQQNIGDKEKAEILNKIQFKLESEALEEYQKRLIENVGEKLRVSTKETLFHKTIDRLMNEISGLQKRSNISLFLGIITTLIGVFILGSAVFFPPLILSSIDFATFFIPRLSLVILIEVFAYFFLRLYKQILGEMKYFHNEITNIESKYLGLRVAVDGGNNEGTIDKVINSLLLTDRNAVPIAMRSIGEGAPRSKKMSITPELFKNIDDKLEKLVKSS